jgi:virginiamycin B lyase
VLWFTGQNGVYGRLDPKSGTMAVFDAPRGAGPYGIAATPDGQVFFASLAGNCLGRIDIETGAATVLEPPVPRQGARRVWSDSRGGLWITGWNTGDLLRYDSKTNSWGRWHLPGDRPQPYAVYVDDTDAVWSATGEQTRSCASIQRWGDLNPFPCPTTTPACGSFPAARPNPRPISSSL